MKAASIFSGIGAPESAWIPLGFEFVFNAEVEPFPCAVLKHRYPETENLGDVTNYEQWPDRHFHVLVGGSPCQSFSVAGLRKGLDDPRGDLMLTFGAIAARYRSDWFVWENVPGVLSSNGGRDFACFLGLLTGQVIEPPADGWENSGILSGINSAYGVAWRILDAQYFGVAKDAAVCSLSDILEESGSVPQRFYLSARACAGILRRAEKRGKELPEPLWLALQAVASQIVLTTPPQAT